MADPNCNPGWQKALTPPHSPYKILRPWGGTGNLDLPRETQKIIEWAGDSTRHGPEGPYKWDSAVLKNGWFEDLLESWQTYGDGIKANAVGSGHDGNYSAYIQRDVASGQFFGIYQKDIKIEPNSEYQLSVWVKTKAVSGSVAAALGVWSSNPVKNHHTDFGYIGGTTDWVKISGRWKSRFNETKLQVVLYGRPDFAGSAVFDGLVLQKVIP
jgi:CubicO group peptidase (beta-lactamase class C family)